MRLFCWLPPQNYQEALRYIGKLPFDQAESNMKRYGKILMHHVPDETTELLKILCTDYQPSGDGEGPGMLEGKKVRFALTASCCSRVVTPQQASGPVCLVVPA